MRRRSRCWVSTAAASWPTVPQRSRRCASSGRSSRAARFSDCRPRACRGGAPLLERAALRAMRRQLVDEWIRSRRGQVDAALASTPEGISSVEEVASDVMYVSKAGRIRVKSAFDARQQVQDSYSVAAEAPAGEDYFGRTRRIERIVIDNFKVIRSLDLELPRIASDTASAPWLMLLGENGCGKSSLLQAVALALMGREARDGLTGENASTYVRNGTRSGRVEVHLAGNLSPIVVEFRRGSKALQRRGRPEDAAARLRRDPAAAPWRPGVAAGRRHRPGREHLQSLLADRQCDRVAARLRRPALRCDRPRAEEPARPRRGRSPTAQQARTPDRSRGVRVHPPACSTGAAGDWPRSGRCHERLGREPRSDSSSSISTASRRSTTPAGTTRGTGCWSRPPTGCARSSAPGTSSPGWAATSSGRS